MILNDINEEKKVFKNITYYEIRDERILVSYNVIENKIKVTSGFFKKLNENEVYFFLSHEEKHKKDRVMFLIPIFFNLITLIIFITCILYSIFYQIKIQLFLIILIFEIISFLFLLFIYRYSEYRADSYASSIVNYKYFVSAMKKMKEEKYPLRFIIWAKITHPHLNSRIKHLLKK